MDTLRQHRTLVVPVRMPMAADQHADPVLYDSPEECVVLLLAIRGEGQYMVRIRFFEHLLSRERPSQAIPYSLVSPIWHRCFNTLFLIENSTCLPAAIGTSKDCGDLHHFLIAGPSRSIEVIAVAFRIDLLCCAN